VSTSVHWTAVVVNYEAGEALVECVRSLRADDSADGPPEVVVVDNGSRDGSVAQVRRAFPDVLVVDPHTNLGYSAAANRGIARSATPIVAVCNADTVVAHGAGSAMRAVFDDPRVGAAGPRLLNTDGTVYPSVRSDPGLADAVGHALLGRVWPRNPFTRRYRELDADPTRARDVDWASGAALWFRRDALDAIGGWDEGYFMYMEDVDVCWRLRTAGWQVRYQPAAEVTHVQGLSTQQHRSRMIVEHHRSMYRFAAKRWRGPQRLLLVPTAVFLSVRAAVSVLFTTAQETLRPRRSGTKPTL
jgi:N-acetylglucosaminyl-diphospho-decaprenol L-rhamnosyltransferase